MLLSAEEAGVQALPLGTAVAAYPGRVDWYRLQPEARAALDGHRLASEALNGLGAKYATARLAGLAAHFIFGTKIESDDEETPAAVVCSQYVSRCFRLAGVDFSPLSDLASVPGEIAASPLLRYVGTLKPDATAGESAPGGRSSPA